MYTPISSADTIHLFITTLLYSASVSLKLIFIWDILTYFFYYKYCSVLYYFHNFLDPKTNFFSTYALFSFMFHFSFSVSHLKGFIFKIAVVKRMLSLFYFFLWGDSSHIRTCTLLEAMMGIHFRKDANSTVLRFVSCRVWALVIDQQLLSTEPYTASRAQWTTGNFVMVSLY